MSSDDRLNRLTENEKVCLRHWLQHRSAKEIALDLNISHHAVEKRLKMARMKLDVTSSIEAARLLAAAEGYDHAAPRTPELTYDTSLTHPSRPHSMILGVTAMIAIGMLLLGILTYPTTDTASELAEPTLVREYDEQLESTLATMISSAEIGPDGEVYFSRPIGDPRFLEPGSGRYWQVSAEGHGDFTSRSLYNRHLQPSGQPSQAKTYFYDSDQFKDEPLRVVERSLVFPGSDVEWLFMAARRR